MLDKKEKLFGEIVERLTRKCFDCFFYASCAGFNSDDYGCTSEDDYNTAIMSLTNKGE
jgi:hypothetical protein